MSNLCIIDIFGRQQVAASLFEQHVYPQKYVISTENGVSFEKFAHQHQMTCLLRSLLIDNKWHLSEKYRREVCLLPFLSDILDKEETILHSRRNPQVRGVYYPFRVIS